MEGIIKAFYELLENELTYLETVNRFLETVPSLIAHNKITNYEFNNFLEQYELEVYRIATEKKRYFIQIAKYLNIEIADLSFNLIAKAGYREFLDIGKRIIRISNKIKLTLLKVSIYISKFSKLNSDLGKINQFLLQNNYSAKGTETQEHRSSMFVGEA